MHALMAIAEQVTHVWAWSAWLAMVVFTSEGRVREFLVFVHQELWPVAPVGYLIMIGGWAVVPHGVVGWLVGLGIVVFAPIFWWGSRNYPDDDNVWKRRGRRLKEKVARAGGKLVVVPDAA